MGVRGGGEVRRGGGAEVRRCGGAEVPRWGRAAPVRAGTARGKRALRCASCATAAPWYSAGTVTSVDMIGSRICGPPAFMACLKAPCAAVRECVSRWYAST